MAVATNYGYGVNSEDYTAKVNDIYAMVEKIARQVLRNVQTVDRLALFDKANVDNGTTVEEVVVGLLEAQGFNKNSVKFAERGLTNLYVKYYSDWTQTQFKTTTDENDIRKVMLNGGDVSALAEKIVASLTESDKQDKYQRALGLFDYASSVPTSTDSDYNKANPSTEPRAMIKVGEQIDLTVDGGYKKLLKALKNTVSGMKFVNETFNKAGLKRSTVGEDIVVLMPYKVKNNMDVDELASIFNLKKDEIDARIIDIDVDGKIYIVDRNAILMLTRLYRLTSWLNPEALYMNFWLTVDRMYAISTLWDCCFIEVKVE